MRSESRTETTNHGCHPITLITWTTYHNVQLWTKVLVPPYLMAQDLWNMGPNPTDMHDNIITAPCLHPNSSQVHFLTPGFLNELLLNWSDDLLGPREQPEACQDARP